MAWLRRFGVRPKKTLGQNFLINPRVRDALVSRWPLTDADSVLEIGSGSGALTIPLLERVRRVWAVEKDEKLCRLLAERSKESDAHRKLVILQQDVLDLDPESLQMEEDQRLVVLGNLPYAITSPIILWILRNRVRFRWASVMVQREYAERLLAEPGAAGSSSLTAWVAYHAIATQDMKVTSGAFWPRPKIDSLVVRLDFRPHPPYPLETPRWLEMSLRVCFGQRRKQLGRSLASALDWPRDRVEELLQKLGIDPKRRGETLSLEEHCRLAQRIGPLLGGSLPTAGSGVDSDTESGSGSGD
jgi:16S rRNA (adenine1518-N6/adenine1519-N6)-dimethyltransferase